MTLKTLSNLTNWSIPGSALVVRMPRLSTNAGVATMRGPGKAKGGRWSSTPNFAQSDYARARKKQTTTITRDVGVMLSRVQFWRRLTKEEQDELLELKSRLEGKFPNARLIEGKIL